MCESTSFEDRNRLLQRRKVLQKIYRGRRVTAWRGSDGAGDHNARPGHRLLHPFAQLNDVGQGIARRSHGRNPMTEEAAHDGTQGGPLVVPQ